MHPKYVSEVENEGLSHYPLSVIIIATVMYASVYLVHDDCGVGWLTTSSLKHCPEIRGWSDHNTYGCFNMDGYGSKLLKSYIAS